jgi:hypothetical protein
MSQLKRGMYNDRHETSVLFGLALGQIRKPAVANQHGWFNQEGQQIGWGDLSAEDMVRISREIEEGEIFVTLNSETSHPSRVVESIDYVAEYAEFIIMRGACCAVDHSAILVLTIGGARFTAISRREARLILGRSWMSMCRFRLSRARKQLLHFVGR